MLYIYIAKLCVYIYMYIIFYNTYILLYCRILWLHSQILGRFLMIPDPQAPCPWDTSPSCVLKRRISRWVSVGLLETVKVTWNDMDFPLNVAATKFGDRFFYIFLTTQFYWEMWLWRLFLCSKWIRFGTTRIHIIMNDQYFWGLDWVSGRGRMCTRHGG